MFAVYKGHASPRTLASLHLSTIPTPPNSNYSNTTNPLHHMAQPDYETNLRHSMQRIYHASRSNELRNKATEVGTATAKIEGIKDMAQPDYYTICLNSMLNVDRTARLNELRNRATEVGTATAKIEGIKDKVQPDYYTTAFNSMLNVHRAATSNELRNRAAEVGTAAAEIEGIKDIAPVTIAQQLNEIMMSITRINQDIIQIRQDMACWCVDLSHLFSERG